MPQKTAVNKPQLRTFAGLVKAVDWYDVSLQSILDKLEMTSVNRTQSMILVHIASGITRPSDIAREMGTTRQNIHAMAKHLISNHIITQEPDPVDGRSRQYAFSEDARELGETVLRLLAHLDRELADRIGAESVSALHKALALDWGPYVTEAPVNMRRRK